MPEELTPAVPTIITADITLRESFIGAADSMRAVPATIAAVPSWQAAEGALQAGDATPDALVECEAE